MWPWLPWITKEGRHLGEWLHLLHPRGSSNHLEVGTVGAAVATGRGVTAFTDHVHCRKLGWQLVWAAASHMFDGRSMSQHLLGMGPWEHLLMTQPWETPPGSILPATPLCSFLWCLERWRPLRIFDKNIFEPIFCVYIWA